MRINPKAILPAGYVLDKCLEGLKKRIRKEKNADKKYRLRIIKSEIKYLREQL